MSFNVAKVQGTKIFKFCFTVTVTHIFMKFKLDMCLWNTDAPGGNKFKIWQNSKSQILTPPHPQGHVMSMKCEQSLDELTVQVWLLYDYPNLKYCTLNVSRMELRTDRQTDRQTDDPNTRCPWRTFQAGGIKINVIFHVIFFYNFYFNVNISTWNVPNQWIYWNWK